MTGKSEKQIPPRFALRNDKANTGILSDAAAQNDGINICASFNDGEDCSGLDGVAHRDGHAREPAGLG